MNTSQEILFGSFPRTVAYADHTGLKQFFVHSKGEWDMFFEHNQNRRNLYSSTCRFRSDMRHILDEVFMDLDSPLKDSIFDSDVSDVEKVERMREDSDLAEKVLGMVWDDAQSLVERCKEDGIPTISVFSGLGVHVHMLYQDRVEPVKEKVSISNYYIDECNLTTSDRQVLTDTRRILRIPNSRRFDSGDEGDEGDVYCIPITEDEVLENNIHDLLERCKRPKDIPFHDRYKYENRPELGVIEGYENAEAESQKSLPLQGQSVVQKIDDLSEWIVKNNIPLPCIRERMLSANPRHMVRFNGAVLLFQAGFSLEEVRSIIRGLGWSDYDEGITKTMTKSIWQGKYSENSCSTLDSLGLCVYGPEFDDFSNEMSDCDTYKWTGQEPRY